MIRWTALLFLVLFLLTGTLRGYADEGAHHLPSAPGERPCCVLADFPEAPEEYQGPAADLVRAGVPGKFGHEEWAAVVLTHELHQHVGIMTVLGAKMAVRAREVLHAPMRAVKIVSESGPNPPLACLIDGLQAGPGPAPTPKALIDAPEVDETPHCRRFRVRRTEGPPFPQTEIRC